ncbi:hypothetical protein [Bradyrhizobium diazoefficiens]|uniref:hypothetical protein n=1 Tax=Bradyrhizobium diazoefficiens TaxID=1355477 RepID=UPI001FEEA817|nr:hypothetical protein [Bradyrhizobium diazoefficiens]
MPIEALTYVALGARPKISPEAARSVAKRLRLPRSLSDNGKAVVIVDFAEVRHTPCPRGGRRAGDIVPFVENIEASQTEIVQLEARAAGCRADFEGERERAERLMAKVLQATAEIMPPERPPHRLRTRWRLYGPVTESARSTATDRPHVD